MRRVRFAPLEVRGGRLTVGFEVTPPSDLYRATSFAVDFPRDLDLDRVPARLWWTLVILCCHAHWAYLRPCRIELPVALPAGEIETWLRLLDAYVASLEWLRGGRACARTIEIQGSGGLPAETEALADTGRAAVAFSAGKDSLLHAGMLRELLPAPPLLVTTTSPLHRATRDHETARRREILEAVARRPDFTLVEVRSDWRGCWDNAHPPRLGYPVSVNETSDTLIYLAFLAVVAWCRGATHLFLASENEVQENEESPAGVVQHPHFMYSAATQRAVSDLLGAFGLRCSSMTWGVPSALVTRILWRRYPDLTHYQYSCWRVAPGEAACNRCRQCFRLAWLAVSAGGDPSIAGFDIVRLTREFARWRAPTPLPPGAGIQQRAGHSLHTATALAIATSSWGAVTRAFLAPARGVASRRERAGALAVALRTRWRLRGATRGASWPGWSPIWTRLTDPLIRSGIERLLGEHAPAEETRRSAANAERSDRLYRHIVAALEPRGPIAGHAPPEVAA